ncbi:hypothetical protein Ddc_22834 [Ditylenchus destructor]|nr:hypothetical protein Ddc_22834 [Ditylenchus destructor]
MTRRGEDLRGGALLHNAAALQHQHAIRHGAHHREVVGHEQRRDAALAAQPLQQRQHLRPQRHVQCGHGLVQHQQIRLHHQRPRNRDALTLSTGELVREAPQRRGIESDLLQQIDGPRLRDLRIERGPQQVQGLGEDALDTPSRVEAAVGILEDDLHAAAQ